MIILRMRREFFRVVHGGLANCICAQCRGYNFSGVVRNREMCGGGNSTKVLEKAKGLGNFGRGYWIVTPWQYAGHKTLVS